MNKVTIAQVNKAIMPLGSIALVKGSGYFYFIGESVDTRLPSVYVNSIRELSLNDWIEEAMHRITA